jgi:RNA polymerase sigma-70 factor (ECF subfamily)
MLRIMTTTRIDMVRKSDRRPAGSLDQWLENGETGSAKALFGREETDPAKRTHDLALSEELQAALDSLSDDFRQVVVLCDVLEFDYTEAANILKIPIGTVRSRLHRARGHIRNALTRLQSEGHS